MSTTRTRVTAFAAQGPSAPGLRVRARIPTQELARHGVDVRLAPLFTEQEAAAWRSAPPARKFAIALPAHRRQWEALARSASLGDVALVQRQVGMLPALALERRARRAARLVLDVDDAIWHDASASAGGHALASLKRSGAKVRWLAARADQVIAGNEVLAEWLGRYARAVTVVPSLVDPTRLGVRRHAATERVVLGWIGSQSTAMYLRRLGPALEALARSSPELTFVLEVVGGTAPSVRGVEVFSSPWSESAERELLGRMDIGLMPLPDDEWTRGKCAYKAIQYMAAGVPVVCDDVGITGSVVGDGQAGYVLPQDQDWREPLYALAYDAHLRGRLGAEGRSRVEQRFSVQRWGPTLASLLRGERRTSTTMAT